MRCIGAEGEQLGILTIEQALRTAQEGGFDLVEVSPLAKPPVCKIMDYGKFKYTEKKQQNEAKKKQVVVLLKEVKLRPRTESHDYDVKIRKIREFLEDSNKARVTVMFRGRELSHRELRRSLKHARKRSQPATGRQCQVKMGLAKLELGRPCPAK